MKGYSKKESLLPQRRICGLSNAQLTVFILAILATTASVFQIWRSVAVTRTMHMEPIYQLESAPIQNIHSEDKISAAAVISTLNSSLPFSSNDPCSLMTEIKEGSLQPTFAEINELRRHLLIKNRPCFESNSQFFIQTFLNRTMANHVMLHIPKTGGTTVCKAIKEGKVWSTQGHNCWKEDFCPMWAGCLNPQPTSCSTLKSWPQTFVMNENYLDEYCDHHTYSILLREPTSRSISHVNHFMQAVAWRKEYPYETMNWRLSLALSNYMVWALSAITLFDTNDNNSTHVVHADKLHPNIEHLNFAKQRLMKMDYIIDLSNENTRCRDRILTYMNVGADLGVANKGSPEYEHDFRRDDIAAANKLDLELYLFAQDLIQADCAFYEIMEEMQ